MANHVIEFLVTIAFSIVFMIGCLIAKIDMNGLWLPLLLSGIALPLYNSYYFTSNPNLISTKMNINIMFGTLMWLTIGGFTCILLALVFKMWLIAIIFECLLSLNPYFSSAFWVAKMIARYQYFLMCPYNTLKSVSGFSFNGSLPEILGLSVSIVVYPVLTWYKLNKGLGAAAKKGNDGLFETIRNKPNKYKDLTNDDMNEDHVPMF